MSDCTPESGTCYKCSGACSVKPGWFLPGEAEKAADFLGVTLEDLFTTKLAVDWWESDHEFPETVFLLAPAMVGETPGEEYPGDPQGTCVFLTEDKRCAIHEVKPHECAAYWHGEDANNIPVRHKRVATEWTEHQDQITKLLGREPEESYYEGGILGMLGMRW